jgi:hypothetical protein
MKRFIATALSIVWALGGLSTRTAEEAAQGSDAMTLFWELARAPWRAKQDVLSVARVFTFGARYY